MGGVGGGHMIAIGIYLDLPLSPHSWVATVEGCLTDAFCWCAGRVLSSLVSYENARDDMFDAIIPSPT